MLVYKTLDKDSGEEISITYDFTQKQGVVYSKIFVPEGFEDAVWLQDDPILKNNSVLLKNLIITGFNDRNFNEFYS